MKAKVREEKRMQKLNEKASRKTQKSEALVNELDLGSDFGSDALCGQFNEHRLFLNQYKARQQD
jgi:hypothetical protein